MKFPVPNQPVTPPLALTEIDSRLGTQTQEAYTAAINMAPHLGGLTVLQTEDNPMFHPSKLGLPGSYVTINPDPDFYRQAIRSGAVEQRMGEFSALYRSLGITPALNELMVAIMLHEVGHADDFTGYIQRTSGDTAAAFDLSRKVRASELATLPLKAASSRAEKAWNGNIEGYRDKMRSKGFTDEKWAAMVKQNTRAYGQLPCEKIADSFALGVLATVSA